MCTDAERAVKYTRVEPKKVIALYAIHQYYVYTCKYICNTMRLRHTDNYTLIKESLINAVEDLTLCGTNASIYCFAISTVMQGGVDATANVSYVVE